MTILRRRYLEGIMPGRNNAEFVLLDHHLKRLNSIFIFHVQYFVGISVLTFIRPFRLEFLRV